MANEHDKRYKKLFSNPLIVEELLTYFVDEKFVGKLDFSSLERQDKSFVLENYRERESDIIWKINYNDSELYIFLLIEFQSTVDRYMAVRFGQYIFEFYSYLSQRKDIELLPAVFPILIYNGDDSWTAEDSIQNLVESSIPPEYIPNFTYYKIIENEIPRRTLVKIRNALSAVFYVENSTLDELRLNIQELISILEDEQPELVSLFQSWMNNLFETSGYDTIKSKEALNKIEQLLEVKTMFTTSLKEYKSKIEQESLERGLEQGDLKGRVETAIEMIKDGLPLETIAKYTRLSLEKLQSLKEKIQ